jgi:hypothetical protein
MNGYYALLWSVSHFAVFSIPLVFLVLLARLVGRIGNRVLFGVLAFDSVLWIVAVYYWCVVGGD